MITISVSNLKGGVGKTTSSVNISTCLAGMGYKTLLVDTDLQANSTQYLGKLGEGILKTYDVLIDRDIDVRNAIMETDVENLYLIPSDAKLSDVEGPILLDTTRTREKRLKRILSSIENEYDFCIIDCPTPMGMIMINALTASDYVIIPVKSENFSVKALENTIEIIDDITSEYNENLKIMGAYVTMHNRTANDRDLENFLKEQFRDRAFRTIRSNVAVSKSINSSMPLILFDKKAIATEDYKILTQQIINFIKENQE